MNNEKLTPTANHVYNLVSLLPNKGHRVFVDNLYNSVPLAEVSWEKFRIYVEGTYRQNYEVPSVLLTNPPTRQNEAAAVLFKEGDLTVTMCYIWDSKLFFYLTSYPHSLEFIHNQKGKFKLIAIIDYNKYKVWFALKCA